MSEYYYNRDRMRNRFDDEDRDYLEGGYGRQGYYNRGFDRDFDRLNRTGYYGGGGYPSQGGYYNTPYDRGYDPQGSWGPNWGPRFSRGPMGLDYDQGYYPGNFGLSRRNTMGRNFGYGRGATYGYNQMQNRWSGYNQPGPWVNDFDTDVEDIDYDMPYDVSYTEFWLIPGPFTGVGPEGYKRSDQRIEDDICDRLAHHGQIDARNVQVKVQNGDVTISGEVNSRQARRMAEDVAESVLGVADIHNELKVKKTARQLEREQQGMGQPSRQASGASKK